MGTWLYLAFLAAVLLVPVYLYNTLIRLRVRVRNGWAQIEVQLKRRHDLIPNLVEVVRGYAAHEKETLERVTLARNSALKASGIEEKGRAENVLAGALRSLFAVVESYPDLKANQNFLELQEELTTTENRIAFARQYYNDEVMRFNTAVQSVPHNIVAAIFAFRKEQFLEIEGTAHRVPSPVRL